MPIQITIIGLGPLGASIGLALGKMKDEVKRVGNDRDPIIARQAEKSGAVDKVVINLPGSVENADVVILALPVDEIRETMEVIAPDLKPGTVLIDTSPVKAAVEKWAKELLPGDDRYFISMTPTFNPLYFEEMVTGEKAHPNLFDKSQMVITNPPGVDESALTLVTNLAAALGATPIFSEATEADGLLVSARLLPGLVAAALVNATTGQPGWREARKVAGAAYATATEPVLHPEEIEDFGQSVLLNPANTARMIDQLIIELRSMRDLITEQNAPALQERLENAQAARREWLSQRRLNDWEIKVDQPMPRAGDVLGRLFGIRPGKEKDKEKKK